MDCNIKPEEAKLAKSGTKMLYLHRLSREYTIFMTIFERLTCYEQDIADDVVDCTELKVRTPFQVIEQKVVEVMRSVPISNKSNAIYDSNESCKVAHSVSLPNFEKLNNALQPLLTSKQRLNTRHSQRPLVSAASLWFPRKTFSRDHRTLEFMLKNEVIALFGIYDDVMIERSQKIVMFGKQCFRDLADAIFCRSSPTLSDFRFFVIEGNLILDETSSLHTFGDYGRDYTNFDSSLEDVPMRLGSAYLFQHCNNCKHVIVLLECRIQHVYDPVSSYNYPWEAFRATTDSHKCDVCDVMYASIVTTDDLLADKSPFHWCISCYDMMHGNASIT